MIKTLEVIRLIRGFDNKFILNHHKRVFLDYLNDLSFNDNKSYFNKNFCG